MSRVEKFFLSIAIINSVLAISTLIKHGNIEYSKHLFFAIFFFIGFIVYKEK